MGYYYRSTEGLLYPSLSSSLPVCWRFALPQPVVIYTGLLEVCFTPACRHLYRSAWGLLYPSLSSSIPVCWRFALLSLSSSIPFTGGLLYPSLSSSITVCWRVALHSLSWSDHNGLLEVCFTQPVVIHTGLPEVCFTLQPVVIHYGLLELYSVQTWSPLFALFGVLCLYLHIIDYDAWINTVHITIRNLSK